jgi:hypothetical protein
MTENINEVLETGFLYSSKYFKDNEREIGGLSSDYTPYVFMTLIKKENVEIMESVNFYLLSGFFYLVFDANILNDVPFYINKKWSFKPSGELITGKTETGLMKIIEPYSNILTNECLFTRRISLKKYLKEVHIPMVFLKNKKRFLGKLKKIIEEKYKNVSIKITNNKLMGEKIMSKYFFKGESLTDFPRK